MSPQTSRLLVRLAALGTVSVLVQVTAVSQLTVFGTNADLVPLVVGMVGLLAGSLTGACFGFGAGLFVDTALVQTLGLTSLVYVAGGYAAGRLRELRDPQAALVPMAVAAGTTAIVTVGYSLMQFLLEAQAPLTTLLLRQIIATTLVNTLIALPVHALVRRVLQPALPDDPRRRRRRVTSSARLSPLSRP